MSDKFISHFESLTSPPSDAATVVPDDGSDLDQASRYINVATPGAVRVTSVRGNTETLHVAPGIAFPIRARRIHATGTTATGIVVLY